MTAPLKLCPDTRLLLTARRDGHTGHSLRLSRDPLGLGQAGIRREQARLAGGSQLFLIARHDDRPLAGIGEPDPGRELSSSGTCLRLRRSPDPAGGDTRSATAAAPGGGAILEVTGFSRMRPGRSYPWEVVPRAASANTPTAIALHPTLPGCLVTPKHQELSFARATAARFWVTPLAAGRFRGFVTAGRADGQAPDTAVIPYRVRSYWRATWALALSAAVPLAGSFVAGTSLGETSALAEMLSSEALRWGWAAVFLALSVLFVILDRARRAEPLTWELSATAD